MTLLGRSGDDFNAVERPGVGVWGALEFAPVIGPADKQTNRIEIDRLVDLASKVLVNRGDLQVNFDTSNKSQALHDILQVGTSAGGDRAKAIIAWDSRTNEVRSGQVKAPVGFEYWLVKFDGVSGKRDDFSRDDLKACALSASMKRGIADAILSQVKDVDSHIKGYSEIADKSSYRPSSFLVPTSSVWFKIIVSMCTGLRHLKFWGRLLIAGLVIGYSTPPLSNEIQKNNNLTRETVVLQLKWKHQYQFAGYYAAKEKGFYKEVGLDVEIHEHQGRPPIKALLAGEAQYAVSGANALIHRAQGYPVVALAAIYQHSPYALLVRADSGIYKVPDLTGQRVMLGSGTQDAALHAMLKRGGLSKEDYIRLPSSFDATALTLTAMESVAKAVSPR